MKKDKKFDLALYIRLYSYNSKFNLRSSVLSFKIALMS